MGVLGNIIPGGSLVKDTAYLANIIREVKKLGDKHPYNCGVKMAAHHILSKMAFQDIENNIKDHFIAMGYNINRLENLSFIPNTLQGACYLKIQIHRSNHTNPTIDNAVADDDKDKASHYHEKVRARILDKLERNKHLCTDMHKKFWILFDHLSHEILKLVQNLPGEFALSTMSTFFTPKNPLGCCNLNNFAKGQNPTYTPCETGRNHFEGTCSSKQTPEKITFTKLPYKLEAGKKHEPL